MKKIGKTLGWVVSQGVMAVLMWKGVHNNLSCFNLFKFLTWFFTLLYGFISLSKASAYISGQQDLLDEMQEKVGEHPVGKYASFVSDLAIASTLAVFGHFFYAALLVIQQFLEQWVFEPMKKRS